MIGYDRNLEIEKEKKVMRHLLFAFILQTNRLAAKNTGRNVRMLLFLFSKS